MTEEEYVDDYEGEISFEDAGYLDDEDAQADDGFEEDYDAIFDSDDEVDKDVKTYERDAVTGRRAKRPKMAVLNKQSVSKSELDDLFLQ